MNEADLTAVVKRHIEALAGEIGARPTGSEANRRAQAYIEQSLAAAGLSVETQPFRCLDWRPGPFRLALDDAELPARLNPFTPGCDVTAATVAADSLAALASADLDGRVAVLHGDLTREPIIPRNFPFWNPEEHRALLRILDAKQPAAVIAVSPGPEHTPVFDDGDFRIPSITVAPEVGARLLDRAGETVALRIEAEIPPSDGANAIGRSRTFGGRRLVVLAHFDTKHGTPGALDNASGVAAVLALAELLAGRRLPLDLELLLLNGEDCYAQPGELAYLERTPPGREVALAANLDGVGLPGEATRVAAWDLGERLGERVRGLIRRMPGVVEGPQWPMSDHTLFVMRGIPTLALTSAGIEEPLDSVIHTPEDRVEGVSPDRVAEATRFLEEVILSQEN